MVEEQSEEDFKDQMAQQAREQRDAMNAMDQFDTRLKGSRLLGGEDSSSEDEGDNKKRPITQLDVEKQKNQILMDKLFRA